MNHVDATPVFIGEVVLRYTELIVNTILTVVSEGNLEPTQASDTEDPT